ncbi:cytochrome ubiquinol oxidase subunit I [bacterium]|nr:cytochrome ubiquinol oxidase subunit I [bacterium]
MDVLLLSRLQFAAAAMFHFLFVPLTLGLSLLIAVMETSYVTTGDKMYRRMARFWGRIFMLNFGIGIITGITLEFQFGTNWSRYSEYVGDIFGSLLAIEATVAFFLESTFIGIWFFGWNRISPKLHAVCIWIIALASCVSAFWIIAANAWMQHPVGYVIRNGRAELDSFWALITHETAWIMFLHTVTGAFILAGFFLMGVSAWHLLRNRNVELFRRSFRMGMIFAFFFSVFGVVTGHISGGNVAQNQPAKLAAMEALWTSEQFAAQTLIVIPSPGEKRNIVEIGPVQPILSLLAYHRPEAEVKGLLEFPEDERPSVVLSFYPFRVMVGLGFLFPVLCFFGWLWQTSLRDHPGYLRVMIWAIPLPYLAIQAGWMLTEMGRQPWIVYGIMRTSDAVSTLRRAPVITSLAAFLVVYGVIGIAAFILIGYFARKGPEPAKEEAS